MKCFSFSTIWLLSLVAVTALVVTSASANAEPLQVTLQEEADVPGSTFTVADVATLQGAEFSLASSASLGLAPAPGCRRQVTALQVKQALTRTGFESEEIQLDGSPSTSVGRMAVPLSESELREIVESTLLLRTGQVPEDLDVEIDSSLPSPLLALDERIVDAQPLGRFEGSVWQTFSIKLMDEGGRGRTVYMRVRASWMERIAVANRNLPAGTILDDLHVDWEPRRVDLALASRAVLEGDGSVPTGSQTRTSLRAGEPILSSMLKQLPVIKRGELITLVAQGPGLLVSVQGRARENGFADDIIEVENVDSRRRMRGRVEGPGRVVVQAMPDSGTPGNLGGADR